MATQKTFSFHIRLGGNILHSVPKNNVTESEMYILSQIHGSDAIISPKEIGEVEVNERVLNFQLARNYGRKIVEASFGKPLLGFEEWLSNTIEQEEQQLMERMEARQQAASEDEAKATISAAKAAVKNSAKAQKKQAAAPAESTAGGEQQPAGEQQVDGEASQEGADAQTLSME